MESLPTSLALLRVVSQITSFAGATLAMGTDINAFIETDTTGEFSNARNIFSLTAGTFFLDRHYAVFDALAGAREHQMAVPERDSKRLPLVSPRGMPSPRSLNVSRSFFYLIDDPACTIGRPNEYFWPRHRCVDPIDAQEWQSDSDCVSATVVQWFNGEHVWDAVSPPGLFCPTWLTALEFDQSLNHHGIKLSDLPVSYRILRKSLEMLEDELGANCARLVMWFDS